MNFHLALTLGALVLCGGLLWLASYLRHKRKEQEQIVSPATVAPTLDAALQAEAEKIARSFSRQNEPRGFGPQLPGSYISMDDLADYTPGQDPNAVITPSGVMHVPLYLNSSYFCLISVQEDGAQWRAIGSSYGDNLDMQLSAVEGHGYTADSIVYVPALNERFLCATDNSGQKYIFSTGQRSGSPERGMHPLIKAVVKLHPQAVRLRDHYLRCDGSTHG